MDPMMQEAGIGASAGVLSLCAEQDRSVMAMVSVTRVILSLGPCEPSLAHLPSVWHHVREEGSSSFFFFSFFLFF
jgi:hypothetical protein